MAFDIPDWLSKQLEFDRGNDLQQGHVAEVMYHGNRPYYSLRHMVVGLDHNFSRDTIRTRLDEMTEADVLKKEVVNNGDIWWINHPKSKWPIPSDVQVSSVPEEATVSEFFSQPHIFTAVICILTAAGSGVILWIGTLQSAGSISLPFAASEILALGLSVILVSYLGILLAVVMWITREAIGELAEDHRLRDVFR